MPDRDLYLTTSCATDYDELVACDKASLDVFGLRDESLEDAADLPASRRR